MTGGILGAFASLDLFFFYFFHELALVPTFIMIGVWGRGEQKNYATFQITLYLSIGALLALVGLIALYLQVPATRTFDIPTLTEVFRRNTRWRRARRTSSSRCCCSALAFSSRSGRFTPGRRWATAPRPRATAMLHAGVLKKFGLYGLIRIALPLLPDAAQSWMQLLAWLCLGNLLYCGWVAMRQKDFNLLIGNSSVAHMGFVFLGIASLNLIGVTGAVVVMIAHGFLAALTFGLSGYLYQQTGTLEMDRARRPAPPSCRFIGAALMMAAFAGCGLPGFANFAGEVTVFFGAWKAFRARDDPGLLGRPDHRRGLHAARGAGDVARAAAGAMGQRGRCARISGASCRSSCCWPACWCSAASPPADRQDQAECGADREATKRW